MEKTIFILTVTAIILMFGADRIINTGRALNASRISANAVITEASR